MSDTPSNLPGVELAPSVWTDREQLHFAFSRSSGPGGQNVNKVNSKTELRVRALALHGLSDRARARLRVKAARRLTADDELILTSDAERTQEANRQACLRKLRELIVEAQIEPKRRRKTKPTRSSQEKRIQTKKARGEVKRRRSTIPRD